MIQTGFFVLIAFLATGLPQAKADAPLFSETLNEAETRSQENSGTIKAAKESKLAAIDQANASEASLFPRLTLEGSYFYETNVPQGSLGAFGPPGNLTFGTNSNYNIGPSLYYTLFDDGQTHGNWKSSENLAKARNEDLKNNSRQLELNLRLAYFKLQFSQKNLALTADSLKLSQAQDHDISNRYRAGSASRLDSINSHRDVLNYQLKFRQAQNDLAASVRDLFALTNEVQTFDTSRPVPKDLTSRLPEGIEKPSMLINIDAIDATLETLSTKNYTGPDEQHPQLKSLAYMTGAEKLAASAQESALWPKLQFSARAEALYPNLVFPQTVEQNIFTVSLSMPLFEGSLTRSLASQHEKEAMANEYQRQQRQTDLSRDWNKAKDLLDSLRSQVKFIEENAKEAAEAARLTYQSYRAGKLEYLNVESADLQLLQAQVNVAQVKANMLNTIAQLDYLSSPIASPK